MLNRAKHNLSHYVLQSQDQGQLVPIGLQEVLPGDTFQHSTKALIRVSPLVTPVMHPVTVTIHHWFVPNRLVMDDWEPFITGGEDGLDDTVFPTIQSPAGGFPVGSLGDYLGLPTALPGSNTISVSALPFRMYNLIYNTRYRDEQLQTKRAFVKTAGTDATTDTSLASVAWEPDYFTAARPEPQLGPDVYLPVGTSAPIISTGSTLNARAAAGAMSPVNQSTVSVRHFELGTDGTVGGINFGTAGTDIEAMEVDLTEAAGVTINQLRQSSAIQRFMERMNRTGARYDEYLLGLGVKSSDARLQLPEFLGGGSQTIQFSEVLQMAEGTDPVGEMRGHGIAALSSNAYTRFFEEHGYVITLMYVRPKTMYTQGINKTWLRQTKYDFWQKELQHIGDQEVLNGELYAQGTAADNNVFGFTPRYEEYRRGVSRIAGEMRTVLDSWHMARIFGSAPALNADFITANPTDRIYASATNNVLYVYAKHHLQAHRLVAKRGTSFLA